MIQRLLFLVIFFIPRLTYAQDHLEALFYLAEHESSFESFKSHINQISIVGPQNYKIDEHGNIQGAVSSRVIDLAREHRVKVMPLIVNPGFDPEIIHSVLRDSSAQRRAINTMVEICKKNGFAGLQFDFENIHIDDKEAFTQFFKEAAEALHNEGYMLSAAVFPRTGDEVGERSFQNWYFTHKAGAYDYKALAEAGDFLSLMTYDQHSRRTPPGPVAGIPWMDRALQFVLTEAPAQKISLGIPLYSYHWYPTADASEGYMGGRGLGYDQAMDLVLTHSAPLLWNHEHQVAYTFFTNQDIFEYLFIENAKSFKAKFDLIKMYHLRGFSAWRLGLEDPEIWQKMEKGNLK